MIGLSSFFLFSLSFFPYCKLIQFLLRMSDKNPRWFYFQDSAVTNYKQIPLFILRRGKCLRRWIAKVYTD